jgi:hypothetical protein
MYAYFASGRRFALQSAPFRLYATGPALLPRLQAPLEFTFRNRL